MLALVDMNSSFSSIEQIFRPDLRDKPVIVASNNDAAVVARSKEAKELGVPAFVPIFQIKDLIDAQNIHTFSSNYELYGDISSRFSSLLSQFCLEIERYSIDECFCNISGDPDPLKTAFLMKTEVWRQQRIPVCVGVANTKTLAKLANYLAKKSLKLNGVCLLDQPDHWENVFKKVTVGNVWGVGSRTKNRLALWGIYSVQDLRSQPTKRIRKEFGVTLERTVCELNGERCFALETQPPPKKEIISSRSFSHKVTSFNDIKQSVADHAMRVSEKLRKQNSLAGAVYVMLHTSRFAEHRYHRSAYIQLPYPTNDSRIIIENAAKVLRELFKPGYLYAKSGVGLFDLINNRNQQSDLFQIGQSENAYKLMSVIDSINSRYGRGQVFIGAQGTEKTWPMSRRFKSPSYTTRLSDIPIIKL